MTFNGCIILPDDPGKSKWDVLILVILLFTSIATPFRIAFSEDDDIGWVIIENFMCVIFFSNNYYENSIIIIVDVVMNFFTAYYDYDDELVFNRYIIAKSYC